MKSKNKIKRKVHGASSICNKPILAHNDCYFTLHPCSNLIRISFQILRPSLVRREMPKRGNRTSVWPSIVQLQKTVSHMAGGRDQGLNVKGLETCTEGVDFTEDREKQGVLWSRGRA